MQHPTTQLHSLRVVALPMSLLSLFPISGAVLVPFDGGFVLLYLIYNQMKMLC